MDELSREGDDKEKDDQGHLGGDSRPELMGGDSKSGIPEKYKQARVRLKSQFCFSIHLVPLLLMNSKDSE